MLILDLSEMLLFKVVDKTGIPATRQFGPFLHTLTAFVEIDQIVLVTGIPVLSTTPFSLYVCIIYKQISEIDPTIMKMTLTNI